MSSRTWIGVAIVGVLGVAVAVGSVATMGWDLPGAGPAPVGSSAGVSEPDAEATTADGVGTEHKGAPSTPDEVEGSPSRPLLDPAFSAGRAGSLAALRERYDLALDASISLDDMAEGASAAQVEQALSEQMLHATATVTAAAEAHLEFAEQAPRQEADQAVQRAAELYDHLATTLDEAPIAPHLPDAEQTIHRGMRERMAAAHRRRAAALRGGGLPKDPRGR